MRSRSILAMATAAAVVGATLLVAAPASANSASFTNPTTGEDEGNLHISTVDVNYNPTNAIVTFHLQNFAGPDAYSQLYLANGKFTQTTGDVLAVSADTAPDADVPSAATSTTGLTGIFGGNSYTDAPDISITSSVSAQTVTVTVTVPSSRIFWTGALYAGGFVSDESTSNQAVAFQQLQQSGDSVSVTGFGPVLNGPAPTTTTATLSSTTQVFGSTPAAVLATVSPANAGVVSLVEGATVVASAVVTNGTALLTVPPTLPVGPHNFAVRFTPVDATSFAPSTSAIFGLTVSAPATTAVIPAKATKTTVKLSKKSQTYKKAAAKITVTVSGKPAGKVAIYDGKKKLKSVTLKKGKASYTLSKTLKKGTHKIKAVYTPTNKAAFTTSTSKVVNLKVKK